MACGFLIVGTAISIYAYLKVVRAMYSRSTGAPAVHGGTSPGALPWVGVGVCALVTLVLCFYPIAPSDVIPLVK